MPQAIQIVKFKIIYNINSLFNFHLLFNKILKQILIYVIGIIKAVVQMIKKTIQQDK